MTAFEDRIAEVLRAHSKRTDPNHPNWTNCRCGYNCEDEDWADHVAVLLVVELGLKQEWAFEFTEPLSGDRKHHPATEADARSWAASARPDRAAEALSRYVTPWEPA